MKRFDAKILKDKTHLYFYLNSLLSTGDKEIIEFSNMYLFVYVRLGVLEINYSDKKYILKAGDALITPHGFDISITSVKQKSEYYCICFSESFLVQTDIRIGTLLSHGVYESINIDHAFFRICDELLHKSVAHRTCIISTVLDIFVTLSRQVSQADVFADIRGMEKSHIVEQAVEIIKAHYNEPISTIDIAEALNFSPSYFCHIFKEVTGKTLLQFLNEIRCKNAEKFITENGISVAQASERCGFNNVSYFAKKYQQIIGRKPSQDLQK